jgi:chromate transporter
MSETVFLELFSLASCLPGPTATQISFAIGVVKKGIPGGLLGGILFQYPGLLMMGACGYGASKYLDTEKWWVHAAIDGAGPACLRKLGQSYTSDCL